ncbi:MAG: hypothetical protein K6G85_03845 [Eubacterium sp.]|nr:hypothetical protein [Eubacterium sp.]
MAHMGASSGEQESRMRTALCIYSGKTRVYDVVGKTWSEEKQADLNQKFMNRDCECQYCTRNRKDRQRLVEALQRDHDSAGLKAIGL